MVRDREGSILLQRFGSLITSGLVRKIRGQRDKTACQFYLGPAERWETQEEMPAGRRGMVEGSEPNQSELSISDPGEGDMEGSTLSFK